MKLDFNQAATAADVHLKCSKVYNDVVIKTVDLIPGFTFIWTVSYNLGYLSM